VKPKHFHAGVRSPPLQGGLAQDGWPSGEMLGGANADITGVQSPPLREGERRTDGLAGG